MKTLRWPALTKRRAGASGLFVNEGHRTINASDSPIGELLKRNGEENEIANKQNVL